MNRNSECGPEASGHSRRSRRSGRAASDRLRVRSELASERPALSGLAGGCWRCEASADHNAWLAKLDLKSALQDAKSAVQRVQLCFATVAATGLTPDDRGRGYRRSRGKSPRRFTAPVRVTR